VNRTDIVRLFQIIRALDPRIGNMNDPQEVSAKADAWAPHLGNVLTEDAAYAVQRYYVQHRDQVIQVGDVASIARQIASEGEVGGGPRYRVEKACPWHRLCTCTHDRCTGGWLDELMPGITASGKVSEETAVRCPTCEGAREMVAEENGSRKGRRR
jgi:hypothetical protein